MSDNAEPEKNKVNSPLKLQSEEEIQSYWTQERQDGAQPLPIPTLPLSKEVKKEHKSQAPRSDEVIVEPRGPEA